MTEIFFDDDNDGFNDNYDDNFDDNYDDDDDDDDAHSQLMGVNCIELALLKILKMST